MADHRADHLPIGFHHFITKVANDLIARFSWCNWKRLPKYQVAEDLNEGRE